MGFLNAFTAAGNPSLGQNYLCTPIYRPWNCSSSCTLSIFYQNQQYSTVQHNTVQYSTVQYSRVRCSTVQYSTVQYSTVQYSTVQHSTVPYNTAQHSTVVYGRVQQGTAVGYSREGSPGKAAVVCQPKYHPPIAYWGKPPYFFQVTSKTPSPVAPSDVDRLISEYRLI